MKQFLTPCSWDVFRGFRPWLVLDSGQEMSSKTETKRLRGILPQQAERTADAFAETADLGKESWVGAPSRCLPQREQTTTGNR